MNSLKCRMDCHPPRARHADTTGCRRCRPRDANAPGQSRRGGLGPTLQAGIYNSVAPAGFEAAYSLCEHALNIDNGNVVALSLLAMMHIIPVVEARSTDPQADIRKADELVSRALALDPNFYAARFAKAYVFMGQNRTQEAVIEGERSLALNPSFIDAYAALCAANNFLGRPDRALELAEGNSPQSARPVPARPISHEGLGLLHEATRGSGNRMASARGGRHGLHRIDTRLGTGADRAAGRSPRHAKPLRNGDRRHYHDHRPTEEASSCRWPTIRHGWPTTSGSSRACARRGCRKDERLAIFRSRKPI